MIVYISALLFLLSLTLVVDTRWERFKKEERMNESNSPATPPAYYELPPSPPSYSQPPTVITYTLPAPYYQHQGRTVDRWGGPNIWGAVNTAPSCEQRFVLVGDITEFVVTFFGYTRVTLVSYYNSFL